MKGALRNEDYIPFKKFIATSKSNSECLLFAKQAVWVLKSEGFGQESTVVK